MEPDTTKSKRIPTPRIAASVAVPITFPVIFLLVLSFVAVLTVLFHFGMRRMRHRERQLLREVEEQNREFERVKERLDKVSRDLETTNRELERLSLNDALTGLPNRQGFAEHLEKEWQRGIREKKTISLVLIDIDFFKTYIEIFGQAAADECLKQVAAVVRGQVLRPGDLPARFDQDRFAAILPDTVGKGAGNVAARIRTKLAEMKIAHSGSSVDAHLTVSVGIATALPIPDSSPDRLLADAEKALHSAKRLGRNRVVSAS